MSFKDEYADRAQSYDKFGAITDINEKEKGFLRSIFDKHRVRSALDCACGTGPHLYLLSRLGIKVFGSVYVMFSTLSACIWLGC